MRIFIYYLSFSKAKVPDKLKIAKVVPIFKNNDKHLPSNYRPISILSTINKIMEKIVFKQLSSFLTKYKILYNYQFGFREKYSTSLALIELVEDIIKKKRIRKNCGWNLFRLAKSFRHC